MHENRRYAYGGVRRYINSDSAPLQEPLWVVWNTCNNKSYETCRGYPSRCDPTPTCSLQSIRNRDHRMSGIRRPKHILNPAASYQLPATKSQSAIAKSQSTIDKSQWTNSKPQITKHNLHIIKPMVFQQFWHQATQNLIKPVVFQQFWLPATQKHYPPTLLASCVRKRATDIVLSH